MSHLDPVAVATLLLALVAAGLFAGLIAGLFGVGGGTVIVPALFYAFEVLDVAGEANAACAGLEGAGAADAMEAASVAGARLHAAITSSVAAARTVRISGWGCIIDMASPCRHGAPA